MSALNDGDEAGTFMLKDSPGMGHSSTMLNNIWEELDRHGLQVSGQFHRGRFVGLFAALVYIRLLEQQDTENKSIAVSHSQPVLPVALRYSAWSGLRGNELRAFLAEKLPYHVQTIPGDKYKPRLNQLAAIFRLDLGKQSFLMDSLVELVSESDIGSPESRDEAARTLDELVAWASQGSVHSGEHYSPRAVADLMVELVDPQLGGRIYDPCFGTGGLLVACARRLRERTKQSPVHMQANTSSSLFGIEFDQVAYVIGLTRLVLEGTPEHNLELGDALERPVRKQSASERFDIILASPPWNYQGLANHDTFWKPYEQFRFRGEDAANLFIQHAAELLRPGGKAVIVVPEGTLFHAGPDGEVRRWLLEEFNVEGVVSLPAGTFAPFTSIKSNLLVFRRGQPAKSVRFCVVHNLAGAGRQVTSDAELPGDVAKRLFAGVEGPDQWEAPIKDLALREWELVAKNPGLKQLQQVLDEIRETDKSIPISALSAIADVFSGISYNRRDTVNDPNSVQTSPGLIRVSDIREGKLDRPTLFLTETAAKKIKTGVILKEGDILASTSGSIGKVAIIGSTTSPAVAAQSITVIRPMEGLLPKYLAALLQSDNYRLWLVGHSRGSTIQWLSIKALRQLPIPVPDIEMQDWIAAAYEDSRRDALSLLLESITGTRRDSIAEWLESSRTAWSFLNDNPETAGHWSLYVHRVAESLKKVRDHAAHAETSFNPRLLAWANYFIEAISGLQGLSRVPEATAQLSILEGARAEIGRSSKQLGERSDPDTAAARELNRRLEELIGVWRENLYAVVEIGAKVEPDSISTGGTADVIVKVRNGSRLPLRHLVVDSEPPIGGISCPYLQAAAEVSVPLKIPAPETAGVFDFTVIWRASRLDGKPASGRIPLRLECLAPTSHSDAQPGRDLGNSPYIVGRPVDRMDMFFGRDDVIAQIKRQLSTDRTANVILLQGNRRTGKTSILERLKCPSELPDWIPIICSFQGGEGQARKPGLPTREVFRLIAREIGWQTFDAGVKTWFPNQDPPDPTKMFKEQFAKALEKNFATDRPLEIFELYLQIVIARCQPRRLLIMLDEFDKLQEGIDSGITSPQVPENIRYLLHRYTDICAILTGSRSLKRLREEYWSALFGFGHRIDISVLHLDAARLLVTRPVEGRLTYMEEARDRLVDMCGRHPFYVQSLCNCIFENAANTDVRTVTLSMVDNAAEEWVVDNEHFRTLWGYAATERRRLVVTLIERLADDPAPITLNLLEAKLEELGVVVPHGERVGDDIEFLRGLEIVELDSSASIAAYRLAAPLMGRWIRKNVDFAYLRQIAVKEGQEKLR